MDIRECTRENFCVECDNRECFHAGEKIADCPMWKCDRSGELFEDCETCDLLKELYEAHREGSM